MAFKRMMVAAVAAVTIAVLPHIGQGVTVNVTKVQQRYPWNGLVDIDYEILRADNEHELTNTVHGVEVSVVRHDDSIAVTNVAHVFLQGCLPVSDGSHRVTWNANADGLDFKSDNVEVFASIVHYAEKYMVIDVSGGKDAPYWPVTYMNGAPEDGFVTDEYRGDKIVLRFVQPGSFVMGSPTDEPGRVDAREVQHPVAITKPFYIGVFKVTQLQYKNVMGSNPAHGVFAGDFHPAENVSYNTIRGGAVVASHAYDWPWTTEVKSGTFMCQLRDKCKEWNESDQDYTTPVPGLFDLPTEAQWEYACRAGTTTRYNNGDDLSLLAMNAVGNVGEYLPNAWNLYDMHGGAWEWCLDWYQEDIQNLANPSLDPKGPDSGSYRVRRSTVPFRQAANCRSASRVFALPSAAYENNGDYVGFRLARTLP